MLGGLRVLDFADERGALCGKILGDLGADVIKVERPGGDEARRIGPFHGEEPDPEKSLHWFAMNASKRGVTLNLEEPEGRDLLRQLARGADVLLETFPPGYLEGLGLGYDALRAENGGLILTSITPFGQTGPYRDRPASDLTILAMSGIMSITGEPDRPPVRMCLDQSYYLASAQAAAATLLALRCRRRDGTGQHVDVSAYEVAVRANYREPIRAEWDGEVTRRAGNLFARGGKGYRQLWPCADGYVTWLIMLDNAKPVRGWVEWMREEGRAGRWGELDWTGVNTLFKWPAEDVEALQAAIGAFIADHTTRELEAQSIRRGLLLSPVQSVAQVAGEEHFRERGFWKELPHPELGRTITYPRFSFLAGAGGNEVRRRAPLVGEHNREVYAGELGLSDERISLLTAAGVL